MGRPSAIDQVVGYEPDGTAITAAERIIADLRIGSYLETAAAHAGVTRETVYAWMRTGAKAYARQARGEEITDGYELQAMSFSDAVGEATAEWEIRTTTLLEQLQRGGLKTTTITTKLDAAGTVIERSEKTETLAPDVRVLLWRMERRYPERYAKRTWTVHADDSEPQNPEERARSLAEDMRGHLKIVREREAEEAAETG